MKRYTLQTAMIMTQVITVSLLLCCLVQDVWAQNAPRTIVTTRQELINAWGLQQPFVQTKGLRSKGIEKIVEDYHELTELATAAMLIHFKFDSAEILPESHPLLEMCAGVLRDYAEVKIVVAGHTDSIGTEEYNFDLSARRANAVKDFLVVFHDVDAGRLILKAYGETQPIASNDTKQGRAENRRVEFIRFQ
jgi:outer membrane protein OmpA-like peptidoglycan-associated protein